MANKLYHAIESPVTFTDSGGTVTFSLANLAAGSGRVSARRDRGAGSLPTRHKVRGMFQFETAPTAGETIGIAIAESDGTNVDGNVGTADAAITNNNVFQNLKPVGSVYVEASTANTVFEASYPTMIYERYYSIAVWNYSAGDNLKIASASNNVVTVTAVPPELQ